MHSVARRVRGQWGRRGRAPATWLSISLGLALLVVLSPIAQSVALAQQVPGTIVRAAAGPTAASIQAAVEAFRADLGGVNNQVGGTFPTGRREINWDAVPDQFASPNFLPGNFFNVNSPRGAVFTTTGSGFQVSARLGNPTNTPVRFGNIDPTYPNTFSVFSPERLFTAIGSTVTEVSFFIPGTNTRATTSGFGVVFTDVDSPHSTFIDYFDAQFRLLGRFNVPAVHGGGGFSFLGVTFTGGTRVGLVRIFSGNFPLGPGVRDVGHGIDLVVMDDFIYGEPQVQQVTPAAPLPPAPAPPVHVIHRHR